MGNGLYAHPRLPVVVASLPVIVTRRLHSCLKINLIPCPMGKQNPVR